MDPFSVAAIRSAYDAVAGTYVTAFGDDLQQLPLDVAVLEDLAERAPSPGPILDVGCGPGQVAHWLAGTGRSVIGIDIALRMLDLARSGSSGLSVMAGDMRALPIRQSSCAGVVAYYSLQHLPRLALGSFLAEMRRVMAPGGLLVVAAHQGEGEVVVDEFLGQKVSPFGGTFYEPAELRRAVEGSSFTIVSERHRGPLPHEFPSERMYLIAGAT